MTSCKPAALIATIALLGFSYTAMAGEFDGKWKLYDSNGKPFEITLTPSGVADGTHGDAMKHGHWSESNGAAVINWDTGWTTRIAKQDNQYVKSGFKPGQAMTDTPENTSGAEKIKD